MKRVARENRDRLQWPRAPHPLPTSASVHQSMGRPGQGGAAPAAVTAAQRPVADMEEDLDLANSIIAALPDPFLLGNERYGNPVLVAITGYGQRSDFDLSRDAGFDAHLVKPVDLARLETLLGAARTRAADRASAPMGRESVPPAHTGIAETAWA